MKKTKRVSTVLVNCVIFVDKSAFREDYARIYDNIHKSLILKHVSVLTVLGPKSTDEDKLRFKSYNPISVEELEKNPKHSAIKHLNGFISQMIKGKIPLSKRRPWTWLNFYKMFSAMTSFFEQCQPNLVISLKYDSYYPLVVAANSLSIPTLAIQHGDYYCDVDLDYGGTDSMRTSHEWPASVLLVWSDSIIQFCRNKFGKDHNYRALGAPLWHARYDQKTISRTDQIIVYESDTSLWSSSLINSIINCFGADLVKIKPHPYLLLKNLSLAALQFPDLLVSQQLWDVVPKVGISFSSTVTDELIFNDCVSVTIAREKTIGVTFPSTGTFSVDTDYSSKVLTFLQEVYTSQSKYQQVLAIQKEERREFVYAHISVAERIAEICEEYTRI